MSGERSVELMALRSLDARLEHILDIGIKTIPATSNPGALGLFSFGLTTTLFMMNSMKVVDANANGIVYCYALAYGGLGQLIVGLLEYRRRNTFGTTAFLSFGGFWVGFGLYGVLVMAGVLPMSIPGVQGALCLWGIFSFMMWCCTFATNVVVCSLFFLLFILFFLLAGGQKNEDLLRFAAAWGWLTAAVAFYGGFAASLEDAYGRTVLPVFPLKPINSVSGGFIGTKRRTDRDIGEPQDVEIARPISDPIGGTNDKDSY